MPWQRLFPTTEKRKLAVFYCFKLCPVNDSCPSLLIECAMDLGIRGNAYLFGLISCFNFIFENLFLYWRQGRTMHL